MAPLRSWRRARLARRTDHPALRALLDTPDVDPRTPLDELRLLAVDVETTGLDPTRDRMLSVGMLPVDGREIVFAGARSAVIRADDTGDEVGQSAVLHGLTDDTLTTGVDRAEAVDMVLEAARGRVLLAHFAQLETGFVGTACHRMYGVRPQWTVVDTLVLQQRIVAPGFDTQPRPDELRLWAARARYGLPDGAVHDALADALACAELYLAQTRELAGDGRLRLADVRSA